VRYDWPIPADGPGNAAGANEIPVRSHGEFMRLRFLVLLSLLAASAHGAQIGASKPAIVQAVIRAAGLEARIMWMDATANLDNLDTPAKVADVMERCRRANINTVVVDVKPLIGEVMYLSRVAPKLTTYRGKQYDPAYDLLATALAEGHKRGMRVYAAINVFSEGNKLVGRGPAYSNPGWQATCFTPERSIVTDEGAYVVGQTDDPPAADGMSVYTSASGTSKAAKANETYALVVNGVVQAVASAETLDDSSVPIPESGYLLVGNGAAASWMADRLRPGIAAAWDEVDRLLPISQVPSERVSMFVNPIAPEPRAHELAVMKEIASIYPVDGIVFDRMRYSSLSTDFSDLSRRSFEQWAGIKLRNWPGDVYGYSPDPALDVARGPYFRKWLEWRAHNLKGFATEATRTVRAARPAAKCAVYVGSWYGVYYGVGVNWASDEYNAAYDWMTDKYYETGYAPLMDWLCTGAYYPEAYRAGAVKAGRNPNATVQAAGELSNTVVSDAAYVYASIGVSDFTGRPANMLQAIQASTQETQGVMLFDLVYVIQNNLWGVLEQAFPQPAIAPHDVPELLDRIKDVRAVLPPARPKPLDAGAENWRLVIKE
jgi:uncharacterized lipoprotein YddW (UPF0748 family)